MIVEYRDSIYAKILHASDSDAGVIQPQRNDCIELHGVWYEVQRLYWFTTTQQRKLIIAVSALGFKPGVVVTDRLASGEDANDFFVGVLQTPAHAPRTDYEYRVAEMPFADLRYDVIKALESEDNVKTIQRMRTVLAIFSFFEGSTVFRSFDACQCQIRLIGGSQIQPYKLFKIDEPFR